MYSFVLTMQLILMLPALPLAVMSHRTSRAHRSRHGSFLAVASLLALLAAVFGLVSLSVAFSGVEEQDWLLSFAPPVITLVACAFVIRRGLSPVRKRSRRSRSGTADRQGTPPGDDSSSFQGSTLGSRHGPGEVDGDVDGAADVAEVRSAPH